MTIGRRAPRDPGFAVRLLLVVLLALTAWLPTACGSSSADSGAGSGPMTTRGDLACRGRFQALQNSIGDLPRRGYTVPIALSQQWGSALNALAYYSTDAKAADCRTALPQSVGDVRALTALAARLAPYDVLARASQARAQLPAWGRRRPAATLRAATAAARAAAGSAGMAAHDLNAALTRLGKIPVGDRAGVRRGLLRLRAAARASANYRACARALATLNRLGLRV